MEKKKFRLPVPGQRIVRTVIAIELCFAADMWLRGGKGMPIFSTMAVLAGIQPSIKSMVRMAKERVQSTLIGAFWGLALITVELALFEDGAPSDWAHYLLVALFTGVTIWSTVVLRVTGMANLAAVVFLSIGINHIQGVNAYTYAFNRLLDTVIGLLIAELVNRVQLPRVHKTDTLFVSGLGTTIMPEGSTLSPYSKVELNRLIEDGALFTISTRASQTTVRQLMEGVDLRLPIITLSGAAMYDLKNEQYVHTTPMSPEKARRIMQWAREQDLPFFYSSIRDNMLIIRYRELANDAMRIAWEQRHRSVYRNYVQSGEDVYEDVVYLAVVDSTERIGRAHAALRAQSWADQYQITMEKYSFGEGCSTLRIYDSAVSWKAMVELLRVQMGAKQAVTFGSVPGQYDVLIQDADRNTVVKQFRRRFEPVDIRGWRTILRR